jgi:hypothetical protein
MIVLSSGESPARLSLKVLPELMSHQPSVRLAQLASSAVLKYAWPPFGCLPGLFHGFQASATASLSLVT